MRVAVVGAGIAGLRTASLLEQRGAEVEVFEAGDRVGGRLWTIDAEGGWFEAGGEWIDRDHQRVIQLLESFGLEPEAASDLPTRLYFRGRWLDESDEAIRKDRSAVEEARDYLLADLDAVPWENVLSLGLDDRSLGSWLDTLCLSPEGRFALEAEIRSDEGEDSSRVGLLGWLIGQQLYEERQPGDALAYRFPTGSGRLCEQIASSLRGPIRLEAPLLRLDWSDKSVDLSFPDRRVRADRVVLALPPTALRRLDWDPEPSEAKLEAWSEFRMSRTVKIALRFRTPFWRRAGWSGLRSDLPFQEVWDGGRGESAMLLCYVVGEAAEQLSHSADPVAECLEALARAVPEAATEFRDGQAFLWTRELGIEGGFTMVPPNYVLRHLRDLRVPEGPLHFAGEHTSSWLGFVEGALESAERVVDEVMNS